MIIRGKFSECDQRLMQTFNLWFDLNLYTAQENSRLYSTIIVFIHIEWMRVWCYGSLETLIYVFHSVHILQDCSTSIGVILWWRALLFAYVNIERLTPLVSCFPFKYRHVGNVLNVMWCNRYCARGWHWHTIRFILSALSVNINNHGKEGKTNISKELVWTLKKITETQQMISTRALSKSREHVDISSNTLIFVPSGDRTCNINQRWPN